VSVISVSTVNCLVRNSKQKFETGWCLVALFDEGIVVCLGVGGVTLIYELWHRLERAGKQKVIILITQRACFTMFAGLLARGSKTPLSQLQTWYTSLKTQSSQLPDPQGFISFYGTLKVSGSHRFESLSFPSVISSSTLAIQASDLPRTSLSSPLHGKISRFYDNKKREGKNIQVMVKSNCVSTQGHQRAEIYFIN